MLGKVKRVTEIFQGRHTDKEQGFSNHNNRTFFANLYLAPKGYFVCIDKDALKHIVQS